VARLLVRWVDTPATKRFDVIDVRDDSVEWGSKEGYPTYLRVKIEGVTKEQCLFLVEPELDPTSGQDPDTGTYLGKLHKRAWKIVESRINPPIYAQIEAAYMVSGEYVITAAQADGVLAWLEKKIDGSGKGNW
jgi:hypothetical protein